jgi:prefoldin subunit 5
MRRYVMDELIEVMQDILSELREINGKLDDIRGSGLNSIDEVCQALEDIKGNGLFNSLTDVYEAIQQI